MNIDLNYETSFWQFAEQVLVIPSIITAVALAGILLFAPRLSKASKKLAVLKKELEILRSASYATNSKADAQSAEEARLAHNKQVDIESNYVLLLVGSILAFIIALGGGLFANEIKRIEAESNQLETNVMEAINETYNVDISRGEVLNLLRYEDKDGDWERLNQDDVDTSSSYYVSFDSYGTTELLNSNDEIIEVQLVRVREEFRLVYVDGNTEAEKLVEVEKRNS